MTTDTTDTTDSHDGPDEVAVPAFEDALWAALRAEHAHAGAAPRTSSTSTTDDVEVLAPAEVPVIVPVGRSPRRLAGRALAAAAAVIVLGAAAVLAVQAGGGGDEPTEVGPVATEQPDPPTTLAPEAQLAADLRELMATHVVATEQRIAGRLVAQIWADDTSGTMHALSYRADGETPGFELGLVEAPAPDDGFVANPQMRAIDHCAGQWGNTGPGPNMSSDLYRLAQTLESGRSIITGTEVVDGRELLVVNGTSARLEVDPETGEHVLPPTPETVIQPYDVTYVDAETSHPVKVEPGPVAVPENASLKVFRLLPRESAGVLDLLVADPPAGSTEVATLRTDEERAVADCT